ncbi:MAG: 16S rRNA (cytosine(1402)-N(4))-methyltransferase RsmH [Clostridiales bacterium]|nr:16S rRNA (cytosine(1402)-N(4))-methyltransferase RsmH [Clostridiales bacterium]MBS5877985.1 16S rRNA (cytosine(1402)-N(4))-methyltransferase RsmH [Clostridiales bacterium]MDU0939879.1 16S rRNA (cytosine(1402)-N(4))-methyltransferase RsmH [Clostridiales bacterium]MDU1042439.1 16S rRNA (cytosine(1402)-N(4))-methyltransferase RsmH [Clostridiales bacterium]MDU3490035.1 16S rRNA (cytosine(1402)-N(4))-methyltransferase RsmH [Clostridiales bacterium]
MEFHHVSVLLNETIDSLNIRPDGVYVDGTLGGGGHSLEIVKRLSEKGRLIGLDRDENAIQAASERLKGYKDKITFVRSNYDRFPEIMQELGLARVDGIVLDLGVSSYQLDTPERGFSYREDAPLDMRMDQRQERTAADIVNGSSEKELINIFRNYGEERFAPQIARRIVRQREEKPVRTTFELNEIIKESIPVKFRLTGGHPSKRTFQAIRIALNAELESLEKVLPEMIEYLNDRGRLSVITFHSLEDRIVKNIFKTAHDPCTCPPDFPICVCGNRPKGRVVTGKPVLPSEEEIEVNKRSKSAKLRVFERRTEEK